MNDVWQQLKSTGLAVQIRVAETGQLLSLRFDPHETSKRLHVGINGIETEGELRVVPVDGAGLGDPTATLEIRLAFGKTLAAPAVAKTDTPPAPPVDPNAHKPFTASIPIETEQSASIPLTETE